MAQFRGFDFPFRKGPNGIPKAAEDRELIRDSIDAILNTARGERVFRPEFGANIQRFVFANNDALLSALIEQEVRSSLTRLEPRIQVVSVTSVSSGSEIVVAIEYVVRADQTRDLFELTFNNPAR